MATKMQKLERTKQTMIKHGASKEEIRQIEAAKKELATVFNRTVSKVLE